MVAPTDPKRSVIAALVVWGFACAIKDPAASAPLVFENHLRDSVVVVLYYLRLDREAPDSVGVAEVALGPGETHRTSTFLSLFQLVDSGVPSSSPLKLSVRTGQQHLWTSQIWASWWRSTGVLVPIEQRPPPVRR